MESLDHLAWTQPADPTAPDVISLNGDLVPEDAESTRQWIVSKVSDNVQGGAVRELADGVTLTRGPELDVLEIPVGSDVPGFLPHVTVAASRSIAPGNGSTAALIVRELQLVCTLAGHQADTGTVERAVSVLLPSPTTVGEPAEPAEPSGPLRGRQQTTTSEAPQDAVLAWITRIWLEIVRWVRGQSGGRRP